MSGYHKLPLSENSQEAHNEHGSACSCSSRSRSLLPWIWCGVCSIIAILAVASTGVQRSQLSESTRYLSKLPTDFVSAPDVGYKEEYFYNYYDFNPSNGLLEFNDTGVDKLYAGYPTKEIDDTWSELLTGTYMEVSEEEQESVQKAAPWDLEPLDGKVYMEVSVFHNLHCLDLLRRALEPDHYNVNTDFTSQLDPQWKRVHIYHCIDQLRQAVQCQSDLTPVPLFSVEGPQKKFFATHSVAHTCRDFDAVKKWGAERNKEKEPFNWNAWTG